MFEHPWLLVAGLAALALVYVLLPLAAVGWRRWRGRLTVVCPETMESALVRISPMSAALGEIRSRPRLRVRDCTRWPERRLCRQDCTERLVHAR